MTPTIAKRITKDKPPIMAYTSSLLLDEKRAAELLGVSLSYLRKSRSEGTRKSRTPAPPHVAVGGRRLYRVADLHAWVEQLGGGGLHD